MRLVLMLKTEPSHPVVLYADDHRDAHLFMSRAFAKAGINTSIIPATDGTEILRYLTMSRQSPGSRAYRWPHLLLLDLKMPQLSGFELMQIIKDSPELQGYPIVVFSSSEDPDDISKAKALGCYAFVKQQQTQDGMLNLAKALAVEFFGAEGAENIPPFGSFCI